MRIKIKVTHVARIFFISFVALVYTTNASAQLGNLMKIVGKSDNGNSGNSAAELDTQLTAVKRQFVSATSSMLLAHSITLESIGKKDDAAKYAAEAKALSGSDCDSSCLKRTIKVTDDASKQSREAMESHGKLSEESAAILSTAVTPYIEGTVQGVGLPAAYTSWADNAKGSLAALQSDPITAAKYSGLISEIPEIAQVAASLPAYISEWSSTTSNFIKFASDSGVSTGDLESKAKELF